MKDTIEENIIPAPHAIYAQTRDYGIFPLKQVKNSDKIQPLGSNISEPHSRIVVRNPLTGIRYYLPEGLDADDAKEIIGFQSGHKLLSARSVASRRLWFEPTNNPN